MNTNTNKKYSNNRNGNIYDYVETLENGNIRLQAPGRKAFVITPEKLAELYTLMEEPAPVEETAQDLVQEVAPVAEPETESSAKADAKAETEKEQEKAGDAINRTDAETAFARVITELECTSKRFEKIAGRETVIVRGTNLMTCTWQRKALLVETKPEWVEPQPGVVYKFCKNHPTCPVSVKLAYEDSDFGAKLEALVQYARDRYLDKVHAKEAKIAEQRAKAEAKKAEREAKKAEAAKKETAAK